MNNLKSKNIIKAFYLIFSITIFSIVFILGYSAKSAYAGCSTTCRPDASSCVLMTAPCATESLAGCDSGRTPPAGKGWCCPYQVVCTCDPGACRGCTPSCPTGQSTTVSGPLCRQNLSYCQGNDGCDGSCGIYGAYCYTPETNTTFMQSNLSTNGPSSISMIVNGYTYQLSTDPANPTLIKLPTKNTNDVKVTVPTFTAPTTSRGGGYYFQADNYGIPTDNWVGGTACIGVAGEDFCINGGTAAGSNTINFIPSSQPLSNVIKEGATGKVAAKYYTVNACDDGTKSSVFIEGYYKVDTEPDPITCSSTLITDLTTDITPAQCTSTTYSGNDIHNPLHFNVGLSDPDGLSDVKGIVVWFSKDTLTPALVSISSTNPNSDVTNDIGIFIRKGGNNWTDTKLIYGYDLVSGKWEQTSDGNIRNSNNEVAIRIEDISVTTSGGITTFDFRIAFLNTSINPSNMYNVFIDGIDTNMINNNIVDQSRISKCFDWGIDLVNPVVYDIAQETVTQSKTKITWKADDSISGIGRVVINGYREAEMQLDIAKLYLPLAYTTNKGDISLNPVPSSTEIGKYNDSNAWVFNNNGGEADLLSIGNNREGHIYIYSTAYDKACNTNGISEDINLNSWFATRGGTVYSQGNINSEAKNVSSIEALDDVFSTKTLMNKSILDLGTELLATRNSHISALIHSSISKAVRGFTLYDSNNLKNYWFEQLLTKFNENKDKLSPLTAITTNVSSRCTGQYCYYYSDNDINVRSTGPSAYVCDKPTLFISRGNINIEPGVISGGSLSGCIFVAGDSILISGGDHLSVSNKIEYDYIEGYLIANNQIIFLTADEGQDLRDGIEVFGSLVAMGSNPVAGESAISIRRSLQLYNQTNPTIVVTYDNKYSNMSTTFFGVEAPLYKQEVGFKPY
jgi:hypothetical protein